MAYVINKFNGVPLITLQDASIDTTTSLSLVGRSYVGYGEIQNENFVHLMENFANNAPPSRPLEGQIWFDTENKLLNVYNGNNWSVVGSAVLSETPPEDVPSGSLWFKISNQTLNIWNGSTWTFIGPETADGFGVTRARSGIILDSNGINNPVIFLTINNIIVAIVSSKSFTISTLTPIFGFNKIEAGVTSSSQTKFSGNLSGVSEQAIRLSNTRTINGVGFNGSENITIKASTFEKLVAGNFLKGGNFDGSKNVTLDVDATSENLINKIVVRNSQGGFSAGVITADLAGNVIAPQGTSKFDVIEANRFIGASLAGNANSATRLSTRRKINGINFDGTEDITITASATTLSGGFLNSNVKNSALESVGTLNNLNVQDAGIVVGSSSQLQLLVQNFESIINSATLLKLSINNGPSISLIDKSKSLQLGGPNESAIISDSSINLGIPNKKFKAVYADNFVGNAETATEASVAVNLKNGAKGSIPYQKSNGLTKMLPAGQDGQFLRVLANQELQWQAISPQTVFPSGVWEADLDGNAATATRLQTPRTINGVSFDGTTDIVISSDINAWVKFRGSNGNILDSKNVTSIARTGSGRFTINIEPGTFLNGNFAAAGMASNVDNFVSMPSYSVGGNANPNRLFITTVDNSSANDTPSDVAEISVIMVGTRPQPGDVVIVDLFLYDFTSASFTPGGATGRFGPTLVQARTGLTGLEASVWKNNTAFFDTLNGIQLWTVPKTGSYRIEAWGAQGSPSAFGGLGARMRGDFELIEGEIIRILVGQQGTGRGGGGGSFVVRTPYNTNQSILVIAGGGGAGVGSAWSLSGGAITNNANSGSLRTQSLNNQGTNGGAGGNSNCSSSGGAGGFFGNNSSSTNGGASFITGGIGGSPDGGFGCAGGNRGGGGGYSGGGSGGCGGGSRVGGGGGSFNSGINQLNTPAVRSGNGLVTITAL